MTRRVVALVAACVVAAGAVAARAGQASEVIAEVRIHGNHTTADAEVLRLAGLVVGQPIDQAGVDAALVRLRKSGRFEDVEIRKRSRSLEPSAAVALIIIVREHPLPDQSIPGPPALRPVHRLMASGMFLPILHYTDGYGFTYGGRVAFLDWLGRGSRVSVPLTWGGSKRAAVEFDRPVGGAFVDRLTGGVAVSRRTNPYYDLDEDRRDVWVEASRQFAHHVRVGGRGGYARVAFGPLVENVGDIGAEVRLDTRLDPAFPRNAVFASLAVDHLAPTRSPAATRLRADARAYRGVFRQWVLSARVQYAGADGPLPPYERCLVGGAGTLRGWAPGSLSGDNMLGGSAELRVPVTSPLGFGRAGVTLFADTATAWDHGARIDAAPFRRGGGAGVFLMASLFQLSVDVGVRQGGGVHVHLTTGVQF